MGVFGGFINTEVKDILGYHGTPETFLYRYLPDFKSFHTYTGQGGQNFFYLNSKRIANSRYPCGIGFGGDGYENFRIFLDSDLLEKSKSYDYDKTFENGALTDSSKTYLEISRIEVWGFPDSLTRQKQIMFRENEEQVALNNRKVDRMEFMGNAGVFFEKQFGFKEQLRIDLEEEKKNNN